MREYAGCIESLYPRPVNADEMIALKVIVVVLFVGTVLGLINQVCNREFNGILSSAVFGAVVGFCVSCGVVLAVAGVWFGVKLLMS